MEEMGNTAPQMLNVASHGDDYTSQFYAIVGSKKLGVAELTQEYDAKKSYVTSVPKSTAYEMMKRATDLVIASLALVLLAPVFLLVALLVKTTSRGPVLFRQQRLGKDGQLFWCYKFRTMVADAEEMLKRRADLNTQFQASFKLKNDPRITRVGAILRKTSLDELPQFANVLQGSMSMIGPRPIVPKELEKYGDYSQKLLTVKPGMSGMWQTNGRSETTYAERVALDMDYIDQRNLALDIKLMLMTCAEVFKTRGAC